MKNNITKMEVLHCYNDYNLAITKHQKYLEELKFKNCPLVEKMFYGITCQIRSLKGPLFSRSVEQYLTVEYPNIKLQNKWFSTQRRKVK
jgi:hypothetical protein